MKLHILLPVRAYRYPPRYYANFCSDYGLLQQASNRILNARNIEILSKNLTWIRFRIKNKNAYWKSKKEWVYVCQV